MRLALHSFRDSQSASDYGAGSWEGRRGNSQDLPGADRKDPTRVIAVQSTHTRPVQESATKRACSSMILSKISLPPLCQTQIATR